MLILLVFLIVVLVYGIAAGIELLWWLALIALVCWVAGWAFNRGGRA